MQLAANSERARYNKLGKPIGGTFIFAGIILMLFGACFPLALRIQLKDTIGCSRFFIVQQSLARGMFVPARRSVIVSSLLIGSSVFFFLRLGLADACYRIIVAAFAAILAIHPAH